MLQVLIKKGIVFGETVPAPVVTPGCVLIKVVYSCISPGTELSGVAISGKPLIKRAMEQPQKIRKVLNWIKTDGIVTAIEKVDAELNSSSPTGYSLSGIVIGVGEGVNNFRIGDQVSASGGGLAYHAEYVNVPVNLVVKIPDGLEFKQASTVALGSIALHGVRRADLKIGEYGAVIGMGILGLITMQLLKNSGVRVAALDIDKKRLEIAKKLGAEIVINPTEEINPVDSVMNWSNGYGVDTVIFTAGTKNSEPLSQAFQMCKKKGQVILVGTTGMEINRKDIYPKELDFKISTSYGPGRYDPDYEENGIDYPYAYVRWTENRNMAEYLRLLESGVVSLEEMNFKVFPIEQATEAFEELKSGVDKPLFALLDYGLPDSADLNRYQTHDRKVFLERFKQKDGIIRIGLVGAGNFAKNMHIPNIQKLNDKFVIHAVMDREGYKAKTIALQSKAKYSTTAFNDMITDEEIDLIMICTRHETHADLAMQALNAGKHVFVEKPLATSLKELAPIETFYSSEIKEKPLLMVGFNRRFSPYAREIKKHTDRRINPLFIRYRMNAGFLSPEHWVHSSGGRIIGEACHIIDLMTFFTGSRIESLSTETITPATAYFRPDDNRSICLKYADGSLCVIDYFACGSNEFPKENMDIHFDQKTIRLNDYKSMEGFGLKLLELRSQDSKKGHLEELIQLHQSLTYSSGIWPIPLEDIIQTTKATFLITES